MGEHHDLLAALCAVAVLVLPMALAWFLVARSARVRRQSSTDDAKKAPRRPPYLEP